MKFSKRRGESCGTLHGGGGVSKGVKKLYVIYEWPLAIVILDELLINLQSIKYLSKTSVGSMGHFRVSLVTINYFYKQTKDKML